jgi:predicted GNAT family N-acyltransferase
MSHPLQDSAGFLVQRVDLAAILPLRAAVLRPGLPLESAHFPGDQAPETQHWAALGADGQVLAVASFYRVGLPGGQTPVAASSSVWQLRGMATQVVWQGKGPGGALLRGILKALRDQYPGALLWCNARERAVGFYERHGFRVTSPQFEIPGVGPHFVMQLEVGRG